MLPSCHASPRIHSWEVPEDTPGMPSFPCIPGSHGPRQLPNALLQSCWRFSPSSAVWSFLSNWFQSKWQGYTSASFSDMTLLLQSRRDREWPGEQHPPEHSAVIQCHSPLAHCALLGAEASRQVSTVAAAHENSFLPWYQFCYIWQHSNNKPELQFQYTTPAEP